MTDFYALLKQSMIDRGLSDPNDREEVYAQARRAVVKQLWDYRPPLAADEIDMRVGAYDTAVERIEADLRAAFANGDVAVSARRKPLPADPAPPSPAGIAENEAPPLADWWEDGEDAPLDVERAPPPPRRARISRRRTPEPEPEPEAEEADEPADEEPYDVEDISDRWSKRRAYDDGVEREAPQPMLETLRAWLADHDEAKVRVLAIVIGALFIVLVGFVSLYLATRGGDKGVTLPIGVRHEVSDAATAARIAAETPATQASFSVFDGHDPTIFISTPDNPVRFDSSAGFARVSSSVATPGVRVLIGPGLAAQLAGHNVRITIVARSSPGVGAAAMRFAYQSGYAISHWQTANLGDDYAAAGMLWRVPTMRTSPAGDYLKIEPGIPGDGTAVDIQSITIDVLAS